ncbi:unnamed protein product [Trypanosoma congolense IL3000]|uniref:WGS project CAEQ00000000 data, annotated contig 153 n=1 Tax=Trypanosoma congolense (strain IL3000) TaxID=1068625 RepID=F9W6V7_TRYCI|nr:unnamed protein product [Trypanosoma congolense IL3000]
MERRGAKRTRDEAKGEAVAPLEQTPARGEVTTAADAAVRPTAVSHDVVARASRGWTLDSPVEDVLMERCCGLGDMNPHDFLMKHFGETLGSPCDSMRVFMGNPSFFLRDESLLTMVTESEPYREFVEEYKCELELHKTMREGVDRLRAMGIISLRQWGSAAAANEVEDVGAYVRGVLNGALGTARHNAEAMRVGNTRSVEEIDGVYDSVLNARWSYVVESDEYGEETLKMGVVDVAPGEQPNLWSEAQADVPHDPKESWEGDVVPGVKGKLFLAVLSSERGWPCTLFDASELQRERVNTLTGYNAKCDAYIRKEYLRVWHIVKKNMDEWNSGAMFRPLFLIGTRGIGKSFATGSLLLYQLLHYRSRRLKVVAYFVEGKAYIFHRENKRVMHYKEHDAALSEIKDMESRGICGYIIYDIGKESIVIRDLLVDWGAVVISWPSEENYDIFTDQWRHTIPVFVSCYEDDELKAALVWERQSQLAKGQIKCVNLEKYWEALSNRIYMVGPLPRYVLADHATFTKRMEEVKSALELVPYDFDRCTQLIGGSHEWHENSTTHKLVKVTRRTFRGQSAPCDTSISTYVHGTLWRRAAQSPMTEEALRSALFSEHERSD